MASLPISLYLTFFTFIIFSFSATHFCLPESHLNRPYKYIINPTSTDVHDLLPEYGLPKGLLPDNVKSYSLSNDGKFVIELDNTCYVKFDRIVYYEKTIKGQLSNGKVSHISGIQAKKAFFWVSISEMIVHSDKDTIEFKVGFLSEELPANLFKDVRSCYKNSLPLNTHLQSILAKETEAQKKSYI